MRASTTSFAVHLKTGKQKEFAKLESITASYEQNEIDKVIAYYPDNTNEIVNLDNLYSIVIVKGHIVNGAIRKD